MRKDAFIAEEAAVNKGRPYDIARWHVANLAALR